MNALEKQFAQTAAEHKSTIYTVCYMFSQDADEVNDLFQEVLVNLWKGFESFEHRSDIKTWIYRVALNTCISLDRKKRRQATERLWLENLSYEEIGQIVGITTKNVSVRLFRIREQLKSIKD